MIVLNNENLEYKYFENMQVARLASIVQGGRDFDYHICSGEDEQFINNNPILVFNRITDKLEFVTANLDEFLVERFNVDIHNDEPKEIINKIKNSSEFQILVGIFVDYRGGEKSYFGYIELFDDFHKLCDYTDHRDFCEVSTNAAGVVAVIIESMNQ